MMDDSFEEEEKKSRTVNLGQLLKKGIVTQEAELGFQMPVRDVNKADDALRGHYDVSRLQRDHPQLVSLITWLLSLPGMTIQAIAEATGMAWESVSAIQASGQKPIREFKLRASQKLALVLDASFGGLMKRAAEGKITALDFKLLTDAWLQLSGEGHTMKFEGGRPADPKREAFRRFLEGGSPTVLEAESIPQTAALPASGSRPQVTPLSIPETTTPGDSESLSNAS